MGVYDSALEVLEGEFFKLLERARLDVSPFPLFLLSSIWWLSVNRYDSGIDLL